MMIARSFIDAGYKTSLVLKYLDISRSTYYYESKSTGKQRGIQKSVKTMIEGGGCISNETVVKYIEEILSQEFVDYGYIKVTHWLRKEKGCLINKKKVYGLMKEAGLLNVPAKSQSDGIKKEWVKELVPQPSKPLEYWEMDIKYIHIKGKARNAFLLTVIDVESRWVLGHKLSWTMKQEEVVRLLDEIFSQYKLPEKIYIRNDNGTQFASEYVKEYFALFNVQQEFTKPATPQQNAHIESYHSILERVICKRYEFDSIQEARDTMNRFLKFYNLERIHSGIAYQSPYEYLLSKNIEIQKEKLMIA